MEPSSPSDPPRPPRRPRYRGRNPRRFEERYKERDPDRYPDTVEKVLASGKTPAGTHRPILVAEVLAALAPRPGEVAVDATLGFGGHAAALLPLLQPGGRLVGLDADPRELARTEVRLRAGGWGEEALVVRRSNFAGLPKVLASLGLDAVDLVLADLGVSSMQLDDPARGFTHKADGPLDMRMNPDRGQPASALLASLSESRLVALLRDNADEPHADAIARAVVAARLAAPIVTTGQLAAAVDAALGALPPREREELGDSSHARVFQALRMEVNEERTALETFLRSLPGCLRPGGRVAVISFHSGEDRLVKWAFRDGLRSGVWSQISPDPVRASPEEQRANPRSRPAKLRWAVRA